MYTIDNPYFKEKFHTVEELIQNIMEMGVDPNYEVLYNGKPTGETAWELMEDTL